MSHRPIAEKQARRLRKSITKGTLPRRVDLVQWVKMRSSCSTGQARRLIMSGALRVDSHPVGYKLLKNDFKMFDPLIDADIAKRIQIIDPTADKP